MNLPAMKACEDRSRSNFEALVNDHLALVRRLAWHVHGRVSSAESLEDLVQAGMVAFVESARKFEDRGYPFSTYASVRIKGAMVDLLRKNSAQSRNASATRRAIEAARKAVEQHKMRQASDSDIAQHLGVPMSTYWQMAVEAQLGRTDAIDDIDTEHDLTYSASLASAEDMLHRSQQEANLAKAIATLDARSQLVLQLYFFEEMNLEEIGQTLNIGAARVCQVKKAALDRLRTQSAAFT